MKINITFSILATRSSWTQITLAGIQCTCDCATNSALLILPADELGSPYICQANQCLNDKSTTNVDSVVVLRIVYLPDESIRIGVRQIVDLVGRILEWKFC